MGNIWNGWTQVTNKCFWMFTKNMTGLYDITVVVWGTSIGVNITFLIVHKLNIYLKDANK